MRVCAETRRLPGCGVCVYIYVCARARACACRYVCIDKERYI